MNRQAAAPSSYKDLRALFLNCTLKPTPQTSHTAFLMDVSQAILSAQGVAVDSIRAVDYAIAPGVQPDMTEEGFEFDEWPAIWSRVEPADILVLCTPIWLGERSSVCSRVIERLYAHSGQVNRQGQYVYYGKVGGCLVTGNEDGIKHVAMGVLYSLQHLGCVIPPQADAGWIGEAGPGPSYGDDGPSGPVGYDNDFTRRNTTFMTWNLLHLARLLKDSGGIPAYGNQPAAWENGRCFDHPNPEYR
jgi:multimeric flavodoxin WrbA